MKKVLTSEQTQFLHDLTLQYGDMLTKYAYRFLGYQPNKFEIAQDAVQETFLKAVQEVETLKEHPNIAAWLKVSLKYTLFNIQRDPYWQHEEPRNSITNHSSSKDLLVDALDQIDSLPPLKEVISVIDSVLSREELSTFHNHFLLGLTTEETAVLESVPNSTIRGRISRIRKKLKSHFNMLCCFTLILFYIIQRG